MKTFSNRIAAFAALLTVTTATASGSVIQSSSSVNLVDGPYSEISTACPGSVATQASGGNCFTSASSNTNGQLATTSSAFNTALGVHGSSQAAFSFRYAIEGNISDLLLPLSFNFDLVGGLGLDGGLFGIADASIFLNGSITDNTVTSHRLAGNSVIQLDRGNPICSQQSGIFSGCGTLVSKTANGIEFSLDQMAEFVIPVRRSGSLEARILVGSRSNGDAFSNLAAHLVSVTLPNDFAGADLTSLKVVLECGREIPVTLAGPGENPVPEPGAWALMLTGLIVITGWKRLGNS